MIENYSYDQGKIILIILTNMIGLINNNMLSIETSKDHIHHFFLSLFMQMISLFHVHYSFKFQILTCVYLIKHVNI